jgi:hypothetical protein
MVKSAKKLFFFFGLLGLLGLKMAVFGVFFEKNGHGLLGVKVVVVDNLFFEIPNIKSRNY